MFKKKHPNSHKEAPINGIGKLGSSSGTSASSFGFSANSSSFKVSSSGITDDKGNITQYTAYLPYGELLVDEHSSSEELPYKFNGKELDDETGLYYYGARYLNPVASIWYGTDPLMEKYPNVSPYVYCHGNPINRIDPDGMDDWEINSKGDIIKRIENKGRDAFYVVNNAGKRMNNKSISFKYGTIEKASGQQTDNGERYDVYQVRGDKNGTQLFEFLSKNTNVEWSHMQTGKKGCHGLNFITTSHEYSSESGMSYLFDKQLKHGYTLRTNSHSHPRNTPYPSGLTGSSGDIQYADWIVKKSNQNPIFKIFLPKKDKYIKYSPHSTVDDFFPYSSSISQPIVIVAPKSKKK